MHNEETYYDIERVLEELTELNLVDPIIVEGKSDERALRNLNIEGEIISFNQGLSIVNFVEVVAREHDTVILLPDWDTTGIQLLKGWRKQFRAVDVVARDEIWVRLMKLTKKEITCVEDLDNLMARLRKRYQGG